MKNILFLMIFAAAMAGISGPRLTDDTDVQTSGTVETATQLWEDHRDDFAKKTLEYIIDHSTNDSTQQTLNHAHKIFESVSRTVEPTHAASLVLNAIEPNKHVLASTVRESGDIELRRLVEGVSRRFDDWINAVEVPDGHYIMNISTDSEAEVSEEMKNLILKNNLIYERSSEVRRRKQLKNGFVSDLVALLGRRGVEVLMGQPDPS